MSDDETPPDLGWSIEAVKGIMAKHEAELESVRARVAELEAELASSRPNDLRDAGLSVAVHNDYQLDGERWTFWLMTMGEVAVKGEGRTDAEALTVIRKRVLDLSDYDYREPAS